MQALGSKNPKLTPVMQVMQAAEMSELGGRVLSPALHPADTDLDLEIKDSGWIHTLPKHTAISPVAWHHGVTMSSQRMSQVCIKTMKWLATAPGFARDVSVHAQGDVFLGLPKNVTCCAADMAEARRGAHLWLSPCWGTQCFTPPCVASVGSPSPLFPQCGEKRDSPATWAKPSQEQFPAVYTHVSAQPRFTAMFWRVAFQKHHTNARQQVLWLMLWVGEA